MKLLSELSVKLLFTGSLWLLSHATAKAISCYRNCTSHKLISIYSLSFVSVHKLPSRQRTCRESDGEERRKCDTRKMQNVCPRFLLSIHSKGGQVRGQISRHCKNAVNARPEDPHELKIPLKYAFSNYMEWRQTQSKDTPATTDKLHGSRILRLLRISPQ